MANKMRLLLENYCWESRQVMLKMESNHEMQF